MKKLTLSNKPTKQGPYHRQSTRNYRSLCVFANNVKLTNDNVKHLQQIIGVKEHQIPCYVCEMKKAVIGSNKRMYFSVDFTNTYLKQFLDEPINSLRIKHAASKTRYQVHLIMEQDKRAAITTNWPLFAQSAQLKIGNICVFAYSHSRNHLSLTIHSL